MPLPSVAISVDTQKGYGVGVLRGIRKWMRAHQRWRLATHGADPVIAPNDLAEWTGDGVIGQFTSPEMVERLHRRGVKVVVVSNRLRVPGVPAVYSDDTAVGRMAAEHLLGNGFLHFGYVGYSGYAYSEERCNGFTQRLAAAGHVVEEPRHLPAADPYDVVGPVLEAYLSAMPKPAGILAANDFRARQVIFAAQRLGLQVPRDVAVVGVDNDELQGQLAQVPLSSVDLAAETIGYTAAELLSQQIAGEWVEPGPTRVPPVAVITRESTDVASISDMEVARALKFIQDNAHRHLSVPEVLKQASVSRRVLEVRFKHATGRTLQEEIWRAHVERAKSLLISTDLPMPEIAAQSGFPNPSRLSSVFRREAQVTPTKFRRMYRAV